MARFGGEITVWSPDHDEMAQPTASCGHCGAVVIHAEGAQPSEIKTCRTCRRPVCEREFCRSNCRPVEDWLEERETVISPELRAAYQRERETPREPRRPWLEMFLERENSKPPDLNRSDGG